MPNCSVIFHSGGSIHTCATMRPPLDQGPWSPSCRQIHLSAFPSASWLSLTPSSHEQPGSPNPPGLPPIPWVPWLCRRPRRVTPHRCACGASARAASSRGTLQISHLCMKSCLPRASSRMLPLSAGRANSPSASVIPGRLLTPGSLRRWLCVISICSADRPCPEQPPGSPYPLQCLQRLKITL